jgi:hypothetical protein
MRAKTAQHFNKEGITMTIEELERRLDEAEKQNLGLLDEIKWLKEKLAEKDKQEIPDFPEFMIGDDYYPHIRWESIPRKCTVDSLNEEYCKKSRTAEMNYFNFHSAEYYHSFESKCKLIAMMLHCKWYVDREYVPDWDNEDEEKWMVFWSNKYKKYEVCDWGSDEYSSVFFSTEEKAMKCAKWLNAHLEDDDNGI